MCNLKISANGVKFNQRTGVGAITIHGKLEVMKDVDDPVIEIWNAVQHKMQTAFYKAEGKRLVNFTPLFPRYEKKRDGDDEHDVTIYELIPTRPENAPLKEFLAEAKLTMDIFYKNLFINSFRQFLDDKNHICNSNGYSLYKECIERIRNERDLGKRAKDVETTRLLLEYFIDFLGLPLPQSKEALERRAVLATLEGVKSLTLSERLHLMDGGSIAELLGDQAEFDEFYAYADELQ